MWVGKGCVNHTSYKRLARKRCKCCKETKKSNAICLTLYDIAINGPSTNCKEAADQLLERVCNAYANEKRKKIPQVYSLGKTEASSSAQTENNIESTVENCEKENSCLNFVKPKFLSSFLYDIKFCRGRIFWKRW